MPRPNETESARLWLSILSIAGDHREVPLSEVAGRLGVSEQEAVGQIERLSMCSFGENNFYLDIYVDDEKRTVNVGAGAKELSHSVVLSIAETRALDTALDLADVADDSPLRQALENSTMSDPDRDAFEQKSSAASLGVDEKTVGAISNAIAQQRLVSFDYLSVSDGEVSHRVVAPSRIRFEKWGYLDGYCLSVAGERTFRIDRMSNVEVAGPRPVHAVTLKPKTSVNADDALPLATLRVDRSSLERGRFNWDGLVEAPADDDGPDRVTVKVPYRATTPWLALHVAAWPDEVEVLDPPALAEQVRASAGVLFGDAQEVWRAEGIG